MDLYKSTAHELHDKLVNKEISSVELTNALYERIDAVEDQVKAYVTLDKENALAQAAKVDAMIAAGEKSGRIDEMLESIADTYDDEVETTLATLTSLMEPLLMAFLGVVIGGIVISMYLPIFKMSSIVGV